MAMLVYQRVGPTVQDRQGRFAIQPTVSWGRLSFILTCQWCEIWWICCRMRTAMASWPGRGSDGSESASRKWNKASTWSHAPTWSHLWELMIFDISDIDLSCPSIQGQQSLKKICGLLWGVTRIPFFDPHPETPFWHVSDIPFGSIYGIFILAFYLTFFLGYTLTFYSIWQSDIISGIYSDILSGMYSDILSGMYSHSFWHSIRHIFWHLFSHVFWHSFWHLFWHEFWHSSMVSNPIL